MENKMLCHDCPYGYEDYMRLSENFTDLSQEEICLLIWCDKIGGKVGYMGCCEESSRIGNVVKTELNKKRRNKRERYLKHQNNLKHLYKIAGGYYPAPVGYMDEIWINGHGYVQNTKPYYKRWYRGKRSKYFKQQSNRKIRRYKGELHKGNMAHKLYDFWWELC